jgi:hypothetical protein
MEAATSTPGKKWYVVTTYSGYENKVKGALQERIRQFHLEDKFGEILIPSEQVTDTLKDGRQRVKAKTSFPGYIFVEMEMSEHVWHIVKDTPKVTGFIGNQRPQEVKPPHIESRARSNRSPAISSTRATRFASWSARSPTSRAPSKRSSPTSRSSKSWSASSVAPRPSSWTFHMWRNAEPTHLG